MCNALNYMLIIIFIMKTNQNMLNSVDATIVAIVHYFGSASLRLLNKAFAYIALERRELAEHVVVGDHGYLIEGYKERLAELERAGFVRVVAEGKTMKIEKMGTFEIPEDLVPLLERVKRIVEKYGVEGLRRIVEERTRLAGVKYMYIGHRMRGVLERLQRVNEEVERNRQECSWCPTVEEFLRERRRLERVSD